MMYTIMVNGMINVGEVIANTLKGHVKDSIGLIFFPSLITKLCKNAGVSIVGDIHMKAALLINDDTPKTYYQEGTSASRSWTPSGPKGLAITN